MTPSSALEALESEVGSSESDFRRQDSSTVNWNSQVFKSLSIVAHFCRFDRPLDSFLPVCRCSGQFWGTYYDHFY